MRKANIYTRTTYRHRATSESPKNSLNVIRSYIADRLYWSGGGSWNDGRDDVLEVWAIFSPFRLKLGLTDVSQNLNRCGKNRSKWNGKIQWKRNRHRTMHCICTRTQAEMKELHRHTRMTLRDRNSNLSHKRSEMCARCKNKRAPGERQTEIERRKQMREIRNCIFGNSYIQIQYIWISFRSTFNSRKHTHTNTHTCESTLRSTPCLFFQFVSFFLFCVMRSTMSCQGYYWEYFPPPKVCLLNWTKMKFGRTRKIKSTKKKVKKENICGGWSWTYRAFHPKKTIFVVEMKKCSIIRDGERVYSEHEFIEDDMRLMSFGALRVWAPLIVFLSFIYALKINTKIDMCAIY